MQKARLSNLRVDWAFVKVNLRAYYAEGSNTLAFGIAEQLSWEFRDAVIAPIADWRAER